MSSCVGDSGIDSSPDELHAYTYLISSHVLINRVFRNRSSIPNVIDIFQFEIIRIYAIDIDLWVKNYNEFIKG